MNGLLTSKTKCPNKQKRVGCTSLHDKMFSVAFIASFKNMFSCTKKVMFASFIVDYK